MSAITARFRLLAALLLGLGTVLPARAETPDPVIDNAWVRVLPGALPAAGYFELQNPAGQPLVLTGAESSSFGSVMMHESLVENGQSKMRMIDHVDVPAHGKVEFAPGGLHLMLMHPVKPLSAYGQVNIVLHFGDGSSRQAAFELRPPDATGP